MTDLPGAEAAARAIHAAMARRVRYTGAGVAAKSLLAVRTHGAAGGLMIDEGARALAFEIRKEDLPDEPREGDRIVEGDGAGARWRVIEVTDCDEVDAWRVRVGE